MHTLFFNIYFIYIYPINANLIQFIPVLNFFFITYCMLWYPDRAISHFRCLKSCSFALPFRSFALSLFRTFAVSPFQSFASPFRCFAVSLFCCLQSCTSVLRCFALLFRGFASPSRSFAWPFCCFAVSLFRSLVVLHRPFVFSHHPCFVCFSFDCA